MSDDEDQRKDERVNVEGLFGKYSIPEKLFQKLTPAISGWIIPAIGIAIGLTAACAGIAKIIDAVMGNPR